MRELLIRLIRSYQREVSPRRGPCCRYIPTCSQYAIEALEHYGLVKGSAKAIWRVLRCNPFGGHGYDPVVKDEGRAPARSQERK